MSDFLDLTITVKVSVPRSTAMRLVPQGMGWLGRGKLQDLMRGDESKAAVYVVRERTAEEAAEERADRFFEDEYS